MCVLLVSYRQKPDADLIVLANRDEFYDRPPAPASFWEDSPGVLAGRALKGKGTWLGINRTGAIAAITNYRDPARNDPNAVSRGNLVSEFLKHDLAPRKYLEAIRSAAENYNPFNLILGDRNSLFYYASTTGEIRELRPGLYGLSNHLLDTPWPKVARLKQRYAKCEATPEKYLELLSDESLARDEDLPNTGVGLEWERRLSPVFIRGSHYGTRSSTLILKDSSGIFSFHERSFLPGGKPANTVQFQL